MMKKIIVFLMICMLMFMSIPTSVFAAFSAVNIGPTTDLDGDVNVPSGKGYYINETLLAFGDITNALGVTMANVGATAINASLIPDSEDDTDLGSATYEWANLYIGEAGKIYLRKDQSVDLQATGAGILTITAANGVVTSHLLTATGGISSGSSISSDTAATDTLGTADLEWLELYISDGGHVYLDSAQATNIARSAENVITLTASAGVVTSAGLTITGNLLPSAASTHSLGSTEAEFTDLYLDDTGYVYFGVGQDVHIQRTGAGTMTITATTLTASADLTVTGTMGATTVTGEIRLVTSDADPDTTGEIKHDSSVATMTGGALRWFDDDSSRMIVDLETDATDDDYVVTYDADADGFYMKEDATSAGNFCEHFMDVHAEDADYCHAQMAGTEALQEITTAITSPDVPRNVSVTYGTVGSSAGNVTITGTLADGTTAQTETFAIGAGDETVIGAKAFATITQITIPDTFYATTTIDVGIDNLLGLANSISAEADIYAVTLDGIHIATGTGDTTNNTLDCGTIAANSDYTVWYHN